MKKLVTSAILAFSLTAAPIATAQAAPFRAAAPMSEDASELGGEREGGGLILAIIILAGIIGAILAQENDSPDSP